MTISRRDAKKMVGKGWSKILDKLYDAKPRNVNVLTVKEKLGGLRYYVGFTTEEFYRLIRDAEEESFTVCEVCGDSGILREINGWLYTRCEKHTHM